MLSFIAQQAAEAVGPFQLDTDQRRPRLARTPPGRGSRGAGARGRTGQGARGLGDDAVGLTEIEPLRAHRPFDVVDEVPDQGKGTAALGVPLRGLARLVVRVAGDGEFDGGPADGLDTFALLVRGVGGDEHACADAEAVAGEGDALAVVARARSVSRWFSSTPHHRSQPPRRVLDHGGPSAGAVVVCSWRCPSTVLFVV